MVVAVLGTTEYGTVDPVDRVVAARDALQARGPWLRRARRRARGAATSPRCSAMPTAACAGARKSAARVRALPATGSARRLRRARRHRLGHRRSAQARLPALRRRRLHLPRPPRDGAARRGGRLRVRRRRRRPTTWRATAASASSLPKARSPAPRRPRCTSPIACCRSTTPTSASCRSRPCSRPRPSTRARNVSPANWPTSSTPACRSRPTATWSASRSIRPAIATSARANAFVRRLHEELRCDPQRPLQVKEFFGSITTLRPGGARRGGNAAHRRRSCSSTRPRFDDGTPTGW